MPPDIIALLPHIQNAAEKLGIVGILLIFVGYLIWDRLRLMKEMRKTYQMRDKWRLAYVRAKAVLDANNLKLDLSDMSDLLGELSNGE